MPPLGLPVRWCFSFMLLLSREAASLHWAEAADLTLSSTQKNDRHMFATRTLVQPFTLSADAEADVWWAAQ